MDIPLTNNRVKVDVGTISREVPFQIDIYAESYDYVQSRQGDIGVNYCHACGEPCEGQAAYCPDCAEYQDIPAPVMVEKEFDRKAFVLEIIESVMELSQLRNAPAEITLELIDAVLVVA